MLASTRAASGILLKSPAWASASKLFVGGVQGYAAEAAKDPVYDVPTDKEFKDKLEDVKTSGNLCIVDFTAKWCGPCRMIAPIYKQLANKYPNVTFMKVDIDNPDVTNTVNDHNISGVPTFVYYKGGRRVEGFSGARPEMLEDLIKKHASPKP